MLDHEILPRGYSVFRRDRSYIISNWKWCLILLACRNDLMCTRRSGLEVNGCEPIWCEIPPTSGSKFLFGIFYRPPDTKTEYLDLVAESFNLISRLNIQNIFLVGDFNLQQFDCVNHLPLPHD